MKNHRFFLSVLVVLVVVVLMIPLGAMAQDLTTFEVYFGDKHFFIGTGETGIVYLLAESDTLDMVGIESYVERVQAFEHSVVTLTSKGFVSLFVWPDGEAEPITHLICRDPDFYSGIKEVGTYGQSDGDFYILSQTKKGVYLWRTFDDEPTLLSKSSEVERFYDLFYAFSPKSKELDIVALDSRRVLKPDKYKLLGEPHKTESYLGGLVKGGLVYRTPENRAMVVQLGKEVEVFWFESCMVLKQGFFLAKVLPGEEPVSISQQEFDQLMKSEALIATDKP